MLGCWRCAVQIGLTRIVESSLVTSSNVIRVRHDSGDGGGGGDYWLSGV